MARAQETGTAKRVCTVQIHYKERAPDGILRRVRSESITIQNATIAQIKKVLRAGLAKEKP